MNIKSVIKHVMMFKLKEMVILVMRYFFTLKHSGPKIKLYSVGNRLSAIVWYRECIFRSERFQTLVLEP